MLFFVFFKQKTAYEMRISDWSSDVCSSDLLFQLTVVEATHLIRGVGGRIAPRTEEVLHSELKRLLVLGRAFKGLAGLLVLRDLLVQLVQEQIGSAACKERVCQYV